MTSAFAALSISALTLWAALSSRSAALAAALSLSALTLLAAFSSRSAALAAALSSRSAALAAALSLSALNLLAAFSSRKLSQFQRRCRLCPVDRVSTYTKIIIIVMVMEIP
jgi:hypothetical protein